MKPNEANKPMHYGPYTAGNIIPPDYCYEPRPYSHYQTTLAYNELDRDIYQTKDKSKPADRSKTPTSVWCGLGVGGAATATHCFKKYVLKR